MRSVCARARARVRGWWQGVADEDTQFLTGSFSTHTSGDHSNGSITDFSVDLGCGECILVPHRKLSIGPTSVHLIDTYELSVARIAHV